jgi:hypothetical protein
VKTEEPAKAGFFVQTAGKPDAGKAGREADKRCFFSGNNT